MKLKFKAIVREFKFIDLKQSIGVCRFFDKFCKYDCGKLRDKITNLQIFYCVS